MGCLAQQEHLPLGAVPQARRAQRQKAGHSRRGPHYPDHPIPYVEEPTTVSRSWGGLLRSAKCRATQALSNPQARAPRPSSHCSEPSFLSHRNSLSIFSRENPLTGLVNRREFERRLNRVIAARKGYQFDG